MDKYIFKLLLFFIPILATAQMPNTWTTTGIGGGEPFFAPSVNDNQKEFYVSSNSNVLFHTKDLGKSYSNLDFKQITGGQFSVVRFTNDSNILYAINDSNGLLIAEKSIDGGLTWNTLYAYNSPDSTLRYNDPVYQIYVNYNNPNQVIVSTYTAIYYSSDGGDFFNFEHVNSSVGMVVGGAFFDGNNIYIGTNDGVYESSDGGGNFNFLSATGIPSGEAIISFAAAKQGGLLRFICITGDAPNIYPTITGSNYVLFKNVYRMDNNDGHWILSTTGIDHFTNYMMFVGMAENDTGIAYLGGTFFDFYSGVQTGVPSIFKSVNGGRSWQSALLLDSNQNINTGWCGDSGDYNWYWADAVLGLSVCPTNKNIVVFTDFTEVMKTSDGANTWNQAYVDTTDQNTASLPTPVEKYYHSIGLENTSAWYIYWISHNQMIAGLNDVYAIRSLDNGESWSFNYTHGDHGSTVYCITPNLSKSVLYAATLAAPDLFLHDYSMFDMYIDTAKGAIVFSKDSGATWHVLHSFRNHSIYWLSTDPNDGNVMYAAVLDIGSSFPGGIYKTSNLSDDTSAVWTAFPPPPRNDGHPSNFIVLNSGKIVCTQAGRYTGTGFASNSGVFLYNPVSNTWEDKTATAMRYWTHDVVVDPNDSSQNTWYAGVYSTNRLGGSHTTDNAGGLYKTMDSGSTWNRILSGVNVNSCTINPKNKNEMFVTTQGSGLWYSYSINTLNPLFVQVPSYNFDSPQRVFFDPYDQAKIWIASNGNGLQWADKVTTGLEEISHTDEILPFPNPAINEITINAGDQFRVMGNLYSLVNVFDVAGRKVNVKMAMDGDNLHIDISNLSAGIYFVQLRLKENIISTKIIKE